MDNGITQISALKDLGLYKDFKWENLDDFKKANLIYGWNYSGKTTLSRLFQIIETKENSDFPQFKCKIGYKENATTKTLSETSLDNFPFSIKVFNSHYIKRVFTWDKPTDIAPISFYLGDKAGDINTKIEVRKRAIDRFDKIKDEYQKTIDQFNEIEQAYSYQASLMREKHLPKIYEQSRFNRKHYDQTVKKVTGDLDRHILSAEDHDKYRIMALKSECPKPIDKELKLIENIDVLAQDVRAVLEDSAPQSIKLSDLENDEALFNWVQTGLDFHNHETKKCKFCTSDIPNDRINTLNNFYSEKVKDIQSRIDIIRQKIKQEKENVNIDLPNILEFKDEFQKDYEALRSEYESNKKNYINNLVILEKDLDRKLGHLFENIEVSQINIKPLKTSLDKLNLQIKKNDQSIQRFEDNKEEAIIKITNHYVSEFLKEKDYQKKRSKNNHSNARIDEINSRITKFKTEVIDLESKLNDEVQGKKELNDLLEILLHRDNIKIDIPNENTNDKKYYTLLRDEKSAKNLSEGEKSAIAFSYFLTELRALKAQDLEKTIVFIDDPISSLDSNHIFQIRSLLQDFFSKNHYCQLFISTHNFEFFSILLDATLYIKEDKNANDNKRELYLIKRNSDTTTLINNLPSVYSNYKSEYVALFHILKNYHESENKSQNENAIYLPNVLRRFLELYTLTKYPSSKAVEKRIQSVFSPNSDTSHSTKLLHCFSHLNQLEKLNTHDDKFLQINEAIQALMTHIEREDPMHWEGLTES